MKGSVDMFQVIIANVIVVVGFVAVILFIGEISIFNASVTKPSIEIIQAIDTTHQIKECLGAPSLEEIQSKLNGCYSGSKYAEVSDMEGRVWKAGLKTEGTREHSVWLNIKNGGSLDLARLYVKV